MGIFRRTKDIFNANINAWLDKAENPEAMVNQIIRELEGTISDLKCSTAARIADRKTLEREIKDLEKGVARWTERAQLAVDAGKDDLAKDALKEKNTISVKLEALKTDFGRIDGDVQDLRDQVSKLETKLAEVLNKKRDLLTRINRATEKRTTNSVMSKATGSSILEKFSRFESKIEQLEAEAEVFSTTSENEFEVMEADKAIDEELAQLKKASSKVGKESSK